MKVDVILGLQYGSEAKGLVASELAIKKEYDMAITVNSCQAGHTSYFLKDGEYIKIVNRQLPSSFPFVKKIIIGAGAMVKPHVLKEEIERLESLGFNIRDKLYIDNHAGIVADDAGEHEAELVNNIGSTGEGVGWAMSERVMRRAPVAKDIPAFRDYGTLCDVSKLYEPNVSALIEGSQGFGLSLFHSHYPKCTSRDCGVSAFLSGAGVNFRDVVDVYGIARTFPIRVGTVVKTSGYMMNETDWETVNRLSGYAQRGIDLTEKTTVTGRIRRISTWDADLVAKAVAMNGVNKMCMTFINYLNADDDQAREYDDLSDISKKFIKQVGAEVGCNVSHASVDPYRMFEVPQV